VSWIDGIDKTSARRLRTGVVHLVGAGPGDPGLLTLRAARLIRRADVIVHDALVSDRVLALAAPTADLIAVGKRAGQRGVPQDAINRLLVELAGRARVVVRLKGGDPFVFGRGGEEALALAAAGVRFAVVPGVTAALGAAAYASIPLTHRSLASAVTLVAGHEEDGRPGGRVAWDALAAAGGTLAIYMGLGRLGEIARRLLDAGRAPDSPCAVISWGTLPRQRTITAPLSAIAERAAAACAEAPALIIVGDVVALRDRLDLSARSLAPRRRRRDASTDCEAVAATRVP
jgi:uroporphyrinogen III methyltransferase/synthase